MKNALITIISLLTPAMNNAVGQTHECVVDFGKQTCRIKLLHGVNKGPLASDGIINVTDAYKEISVPYARLHDCHFPNPDVVDMHAVFPDPKADPSDPYSYDFRLTDEYLLSIHNAGTDIVYRLGESIEHTTVKRYVVVPKDLEKWTDIAIGIIRHYNEGWANGFYLNIRYWEIWNEAENVPAMWNGTNSDYFKLYKTAASAIKKQFPNLKIGGPSVGYTGVMENGHFSASKFVLDFLNFCKRESVPLDFFSWHCYTSDVNEILEKAKEFRHILDDLGFKATESHLNEWNYLPDNSWDALSKSISPEAREAFYGRMQGLEGAVFIASVLLEMQKQPIDMMCFYHGGLGLFGIFNEYGRALDCYYGLQAFSMLTRTPVGVEATGDFPGILSIGAGISTNNRKASILMAVSSTRLKTVEVSMNNLPWRERTVVVTRCLVHNRGIVETSKQVFDNGKAILTIPISGQSLVYMELAPQ